MTTTHMHSLYSTAGFREVMMKLQGPVPSAQAPRVLQHNKRLPTLNPYLTIKGCSPLPEEAPKAENLRPIPPKVAHPKGTGAAQGATCVARRYACGALAGGMATASLSVHQAVPRAFCSEGCYYKPFARLDGEPTMMMVLGLPASRFVFRWKMAKEGYGSTNSAMTPAA